VELRATKTGNLIFISTAHLRVGNAAVSHSPAASRLMYVVHSDLYCADTEAIRGVFLLLKHPKISAKISHIDFN